MDVMTEYTRWLDMFAGDSKLVAKLTGLKNDPKELEDRFFTEMAFGTAGMRGIMGYGLNRMNIYTVRRATAGLAEYLKRTPDIAQKGVAIAYDSRNNSRLFARQTALVLAARGVKAYLFDDLRPVPILSFAVRHLKCAAGVVITASHNPAQYNGYKVYGADGAQMSPEAAHGVTQAISCISFTQCLPMEESDALDAGLLQYIGNEEVDDDYIRMVCGLSVTPELLRQEGGKLSIVYTPLHGAGNVPVRRALDESGIKNVTVVKEQELPDGDFPTVKAPNPEDPGAFALAIPLAQKVDASVVFGTDPDCDRLGVAVRDGAGVFHTLTGNQIGCLLLHHILSAKQKAGTLPGNGAVCKSIVTTELARAICEGFGVMLFDTLTGFKFIGEKIQGFEETGSHTFLFGFEESFGYLSSTAVRDKDGVNASLLIAEAACVCMHENITLYDRLQEIFGTYGFWSEQVKSVTLPGKDGVEKIKRIMDGLRQSAPGQVGEFKVTAVRDYLKGTRTQEGVAEKLPYLPSDVLYFELENGHWFCVRPSGTEPKIKLYVNTRAQSLKEAETLNQHLMAAADDLLKA